MPLHIRRAKDIKDVISSHEVIGYASLNSDDSCDGLAGTNLVTKDGEMKHPVTQKRKKAKMINMLDDSCESITASNKEVTNSLEKIAKAIENDSSSNNNHNELVDNYKRMETNFDEFKTEVKSQFNTLNMTLNALLSKFE